MKKRLLDMGMPPIFLPDLDLNLWLSNFLVTNHFLLKLAKKKGKKK